MKTTEPTFEVTKESKESLSLYLDIMIFFQENNKEMPTEIKERLNNTSFEGLIKICEHLGIKVS